MKDNFEYEYVHREYQRDYSISELLDGCDFDLNNWSIDRIMREVRELEKTLILESGNCSVRKLKFNFKKVLANRS